MLARAFLSESSTALCIVDVQEKLFPLCQSYREVAAVLKRAIKAFSLLDLPIVATEQYPQGLGKTSIDLPVEPIEKRTFSSFREPKVRSRMESLPVRNWVLCGIESHVCVLQTAKDLLASDYGVVVLSDGVTSRRKSDVDVALGELRAAGARIASLELILFELLRDSTHPQFKQISGLIK